MCMCFLLCIHEASNIYGPFRRKLATVTSPLAAKVNEPTKIAEQIKVQW